MSPMADAIIMTIEGVRTRASTNEALLTLALPLEQAALVSGFLSRIGRQVGVAFADMGANLAEKNNHAGQSAPAGKHPYGEQAKALKLSGFFRSPEVWRALGADDEFRAWVQRQPSAWSGEFSEYVNGEGRCEAAHVSRIEYGRGIGHKPEYACIPLTHKEHALHHAKGESVFSIKDTNGRQWMEKMRIKYVEQWAWETLRALFEGYDSMGEIPPGHIRGWALQASLSHLLPVEYREESKVNQD